MVGYSGHAPVELVVRQAPVCSTYWHAGISIACHLLMPDLCCSGAVPEMVQLLSSTSAKARNVAAQTLAKLIAAYPDARSVFTECHAQRHAT